MSDNALVLSLDKERTVTLTGESDCFEDTAFEHKDFEFEVLPITRGMFDRAVKKHTRHGKRGVPRTDDNAVASDLFIWCVQGWKGLKGVGGKELPYTRENKELLADVQLILASAVTDGALRSDENDQSAEAEDLGNSGSPGNGD